MRRSEGRRREVECRRECRRCVKDWASVEGGLPGRLEGEEPVESSRLGTSRERSEISVEDSESLSGSLVGAVVDGVWYGL